MPLESRRISDNLFVKPTEKVTGEYLAAWRGRMEIIHPELRDLFMGIEQSWQLVNTTEVAILLENSSFFEIAGVRLPDSTDDPAVESTHFGLLYRLYAVWTSAMELTPFLVQTGYIPEDKAEVGNIGAEMVYKWLEDVYCGVAETSEQVNPNLFTYLVRAASRELLIGSIEGDQIGELLGEAYTDKIKLDLVEEISSFPDLPNEFIGKVDTHMTILQLMAIKHAFAGGDDELYTEQPYVPAAVCALGAVYIDMERYPRSLGYELGIGLAILAANLAQFPQQQMRLFVTEELPSIIEFFGQAGMIRTEGGSSYIELFPVFMFITLTWIAQAALKLRENSSLWGDMYRLMLHELTHCFQYLGKNGVPTEKYLAQGDKMPHGLGLLSFDNIDHDDE